MISATTKPQNSVLIVDADIVTRHAIAEYLRACGYGVVEAANTDEAFVALSEPELSIDIALLAVIGNATQHIFEFARHANTERPNLAIKLAGGIEGVARAAAGLCDNGPHLKRPYEPEQVVDYIKRIRATFV